MTSRRRWLIVTALAILIGLGISHYLVFLKGQKEELADYLPAIQRIKSVEPFAHLYQALRALRVVALHPDAIAAADADTLCRQAEEYARAIELERLPALREAGNDDEVRREEKVVRESRSLIARIRR